MMMLSRTFVIIILLMKLVPACAAPPSSTPSLEKMEPILDHWQYVSETMLSNARIILRPTLTASERSIEKEIHYRIASSGNMNAFSYRDNDGYRRVRLFAGSAQIFGWIAAAEVIAAETGNEACFLDYMKYLMKSTMLNTQRRAANLDPIPVLEPILATQQRVVLHCPTSQVLKYKEIVKRERSYIGKQAEASFMLLWLHEVGHHVLGHLDTEVITLIERRKRESDADEWAVRTMARANQFPSVGRPFFYFISAFQGMSEEEERRSDHPLGYRRARNIFQVIRVAVADNEQLMSFLKKMGGENKFFNDLRMMEKQADALIPNK
jgi:hypothetical protein